MPFLKSNINNAASALHTIRRNAYVKFHAFVLFLALSQFARRNPHLFCMLSCLSRSYCFNSLKMPNNCKHSDGASGTTKKLHRTESKNKARNRRRNRKKRKQSLLMHLHHSKPHQVETQLITTPSLVAPPVNEINLVDNTDRPATSSAHDNCSSSNNSNARNIWFQHYSTAVGWQAKYQTDYWKHVAQRRKLENERLQSRIAHLERCVVANRIDRNRDSDEREGYLQFLEITTRHQIQKRLDKNELDKLYI